MLDATHLGFHLRYTRERRGLSQPAVAQALNLSRAAITNIESGTRAVSTLELTRLANLYDCSPAALLEQTTVPLASDEVRVVRRATDGDAAQPFTTSSISAAQMPNKIRSSAANWLGSPPKLIDARKFRRVG